MSISKYKGIIVDYVQDNRQGHSYLELAQDLTDNPVPYSTRHIRRYISELFAEKKIVNHPINFTGGRADNFYYTGTPFIGTALKDHMLDKIQEQGYYNVLFESDAHGWLCDLKAQRVINQILSDNKFDEVCLNGDMIDLPYISSHTQKLYTEGILSGYSEVDEIKYTTDQILLPKSLASDAKVRLRLGNHDYRITKPNLLNKGQLSRLAIVYKHFETTKFEEMLGLENMGIVYDDSDIFSYFGIFECTHGLSLAKNAVENNINMYQSSGTSGHSHRLNSKYMNKRNGVVGWFESGCTRLTEQVEYFPTGIIPDWTQGFVTVHFYIDNGKVKFSAQTHMINKGRCYFNGKLYSVE